MLISYFFCSSVFSTSTHHKYSSTTAFENNGSLTIRFSLSTNFMKSESLSSLLWFFLIVSTFLDHLSLALPGNFD